MNPLTFFRSAPYIVIVALIAALAWTTNLYLGKRDQFTALVTSVRAIGEAAKLEAVKKTQEGVDNLKIVKDKHEKELPAIRRDAVANYRMRNPVASSCPVSGNGPGQQVDDGAKQERVLDEPFIAECATDASKVAAFQEYCSLNHCPVKE